MVRGSCSLIIAVVSSLVGGIISTRSAQIGDDTCRFLGLGGRPATNGEPLYGQRRQRANSTTYRDGPDQTNFASGFTSVAFNEARFTSR